MSQTGLPAVAVRVQVDLAVQVQHLGLQSLSESPQSDAATLTGRQLRSAQQEIISEQNHMTRVTRQSHDTRMIKKTFSHTLTLCKEQLQNDISTIICSV